jgi:hypothetical protein
MANPSVIDIPVSVWTLLATNVNLGTIKILIPDAGYHFTYRETGDPVPDADDWKNVQRCDRSSAMISSPDFAVDVYGWCPPSTAGRVEVSV